MQMSYLPESIVYKGVVYNRVNLPYLEAKKLSKKKNKKIREVEVLPTILRGRTDLFGNEYRPTRWIFMEE